MNNISGYFCEYNNPERFPGNRTVLGGSSLAPESTEVTATEVPAVDSSSV